MDVELSGRCSADGMAKLLAPAISEGDGLLRLSLGEECFLYPSAVAWLTTQLCRWQHDGNELTVDVSKNPQVGAYLTRMDLFEHLGLDGNPIGERRTAGGRFLPIKAIDDEDSVYDVVDAILDLLMMHFDNAREILPAVEWALNEITDNIVIHSETPSPGHVFAQFYPSKDILSVAITDAGRGLRQTLSEAHEVDSDKRALELAMQRGITRGVGQGNGIAGTRQILQPASLTRFVARHSRAAWTLDDDDRRDAAHRGGRTTLREWFSASVHRHLRSRSRTVMNSPG